MFGMRFSTVGALFAGVVFVTLRFLLAVIKQSWRLPLPHCSRKLHWKRARLMSRNSTCCLSKGRAFAFNFSFLSSIAEWAYPVASPLVRSLAQYLANCQLVCCLFRQTMDSAANVWVIPNTPSSHCTMIRSFIITKYRSRDTSSLSVPANRVKSGHPLMSHQCLFVFGHPQPEVICARHP